MIDAINHASLLSSLSTTGLMGFMIIIMGFIIKNFYSKFEAENSNLRAKVLHNIKEILDELRVSNSQQKMEIEIQKSNKDLLQENYKLQLEKHDAHLDASKKTLETLGANDKILLSKMNGIEKEVKEVNTKVNYYTRDREIKTEQTTK